MTRAKFGDVHVIRLFKWTESLDFRSKLRSGSGDDWAATRAMAWVALVAGPPLVGHRIHERSTVERSFITVTDQSTG